MPATERPAVEYAEEEAQEMVTAETRDGTAAARRAETRRRMQEALRDPAFAATMQQAMAGEDPVGDELLERAWAGEFGEEVYRERYGRPHPKR